jgi:thiamine-monophosphate kinase
MLELAGESGVAIIGGDTSRAPLVSIVITVFGHAEDERKMLMRSAARPGDQVAVTGRLGASAGGLEMLCRRLQFDAEVTAELRAAFNRPVPRIAAGQLLAAQGVKAAIDISDGLIADLKHVCEASGVGAKIAIDHVPVAPALQAGFDRRALELALSGGEDYELLFTAGAGVMARVQEAASCPVTVVGEITAEKAGEVLLVDAQGAPFRMSKTGWEHFSK